MTQQYIAWLEAADEGEVSYQLGGKAQALAELYQIGAPIPRGFVLLPQAFTDSLSAIRGKSSNDNAPSSIPESAE